VAEESDIVCFLASLDATAGLLLDGDTAFDDCEHTALTTKEDLFDR
jgi:hypothetical protein